MSRLAGVVFTGWLVIAFFVVDELGVRRLVALGLPALLLGMLIGWCQRDRARDDR